MSHRLAWFYMTGEWPKNHIDHVNGLEGDNRWCNLREATNSENMLNRKMNKNNKTGVKGVSFDNQTQRWSVQVYYKKKNYKKRFDDFEVACEFAEFLREELHGEYARFEQLKITLDTEEELKDRLEHLAEARIQKLKRGR